MKRYWLNLQSLMIGFCCTFSATAAENITTELNSVRELIEQAVVKFEQTQTKYWSYTVARYENEEGDVSSSIEQYSPQLAQKWLLKQINGQHPTKKQIEKFTRKKTETDNQDNNTDVPLRRFINLESLSLVSVDDKYIVMAFDVYIKELGKDALGKLQGKLTYHQGQQFIEQITIWNNAHFSPMLAANISDFELTFTFLQVNNVVHIKQSKMKMIGSFAYFTVINETSQDNYSEYLYSLPFKVLDFSGN